MTYFKDTQNKPFYDPSESVIAKYSLTPISEEEFNTIVEKLNTPTPEQILQRQLAKAQRYLNDTDYVVVKMAEVLVAGEDITAMKAQYADVISEREVKRTFIRENS